MSALRYAATCGPKSKYHCFSVEWYSMNAHIHHITMAAHTSPLRPVLWFGRSTICFGRIIFIFVKWIHFDLSLSFPPPAHDSHKIRFQRAAKTVWICNGHFTRSFFHVIHPTSKLTTTHPTTAQQCVVFFSHILIVYLRRWLMVCPLEIYIVVQTYNNAGSSLSYVPSRPIVLYFFSVFFVVACNRTCFIRCTHMKIMLHWNTHWHQIGPSRIK